MEVIALVISICAFLVSVAVPIFEFIWNQKMNQHNLEAEYFRDIFGEILYQDMPQAISFIHFNGEEVSGTDIMCEVLRKIRTRAVYFKVADEKFYTKLKKSVQELEDYIVKSPDQMTSAEFATFFAAINEKVEVIYKYMSDSYVGRKSRK